jgi:hypothetical protein
LAEQEERDDENYVIRSWICEERYQEGPPMTEAEACGCGMFAIGRCRRCNRLVCGVHSEMCDGELLCDEHAEAARRSAEEEEARRAVDAERERRDGEAAERRVGVAAETARARISEEARLK